MRIWIVKENVQCNQKLWLLNKCSGVKSIKVAVYEDSQVDA